MNQYKRNPKDKVYKKGDIVNERTAYTIYITCEDCDYCNAFNYRSVSGLTRAKTAAKNHARHYGHSVILHGRVRENYHIKGDCRFLRPPEDISKTITKLNTGE